MSKELIKLEKRASQKIITDEEHIEKIVRYILSMRFSQFKKDEVRYKYLKNDLSKGFRINEADVDKMTLEDILVLIGYEPGNSYFDPPEIRIRSVSKAFNAAGNSYVLALMFNFFAQKNLYIREFLHIGLDAYTQFVHDEIHKALDSGAVSFTCFSRLVRKVNLFRQKSIKLLNDDSQWMDQGSITLGKVISKVVSKGGRSWMCAVKSLDAYVSDMIEIYELINSLFMDTIRVPFIHAGRERFSELVNISGDPETEQILNMDYEMCYEDCVRFSMKGV